MEYEKREPQTTCLQCGDKIVYGRADKKFCCPACKNKYHNKLASKSKQARQTTVKLLEDNYRVLENLLRTGIRSMTIEDIEGLGFTTRLFTSSHRGRRGSIYYCFDIGYRMSEARIFRIGRVK